MGGWAQRLASSGHLRTAAAGSSAPWPNGTSCQPGSSAAGRRWPPRASCHAKPHPWPACIYLAGLGLACFLFAAQWPSVQDRQSSSVLSDPLTWEGAPPQAHSAQMGQGWGDSPGPQRARPVWLWQRFGGWGIRQCIKILPLLSLRGHPCIFQGPQAQSGSH